MKGWVCSQNSCSALFGIKFSLCVDPLGIKFSLCVDHPKKRVLGEDVFNFLVKGRQKEVGEKRRRRQTEVGLKRGDGSNKK